MNLPWDVSSYSVSPIPQLDEGEPVWRLLSQKRRIDHLGSLLT